MRQTAPDDISSVSKVNKGARPAILEVQNLEQQLTTQINLKTASNEVETNVLEKKRKKRVMKAKKLVLNVSLSKYHVVRYVARSLFKMRLSNAPYHPEYED
jgi:hypothetical protein